jgi:hypothetical protein
MMMNSEVSSIVMIECKECGNPFIPMRGANSIVQSRTCNPCRFRINIEARHLLKSKPLKTALKSNVQVGRKSRTTDYSKMSHPALLKLAVRHFNQFIRNRDELPNRTFYCPTCKKTKVIDGDNYQACHCFPAGFYTALRFNEQNVWGGCKACNYHKHGASYEYNDWVRNKIGEVEYQKLLLMKNQSGKQDRFQLIMIIEKYKSLNKSHSKNSDQ